MENNIQFISPDVEHRYVRKLGEEHLNIEFTKDYEEIRNSDKPMIIWNAYGYLAHPQETYKRKYELYKEMVDKGKDVYIVERGALPNTIFIDKNKMLYDSDAYKEDKWNKEFLEEKINNAEEYIKWLRGDEHTLEPQQSKRKSKEEFFNDLEIDSSEFEKIIFVPLQIHNDTVTILWSDWVENTTKFLEYIKELADKNPQVLFLIKNHPCEEDSYKTSFESQNIRITDNFHYKDCLEYCDRVITINSGIGLQAMCWEKPVAICGRAFYEINGINIKINDKYELQTFLEYEIPFDKEKMKKFIYYLVNEFYTECYMQKVSRNASVPKLIKTVRLPQNEKIVDMSTISNKLKILYPFNEYGWAFEFEAKNYKKYSKHDIIPFHYNPLKFELHRNDLQRILNINPDIIVIPSAWHYMKIARSYIKDLKQAGIKLVIQYNSHYEPKYFCQYADLIMCSSQKLYDEVNSKYNYSNIIKQHHFVDTERFDCKLNQSKILGWAGRFDNPVKRTKLLFQLNNPILIKSNYHNYLIPDRSHDDMVDFYNKIEILLIISEHEGSPYPLLEAMSCGKVVISTDVGITSEVLDKLCVVPNTTDEEIIKNMQNKIDEILENQELSKKISLRNRKYIEDNLSWKNNYHILDNIYSNLVQKNNTEYDNKMNFSDSNFSDILTYLNQQNIKYWLVNDSCLDTIRYCKLFLKPNTLQIASTLIDSEKILELLIKNGWTKINNVLKKDDRIISLTVENERKTKIMSLYGIDVNVPFPVVNYLTEKFGSDWRHYGNCK